MFQKSKGGRGKKADIPYARGSFTLPPELKQYLDAQAEKHQVSMSEMLARILQEHQEMTARPQTPQPAVIPEGESTTPTAGGTSTARTAPKKKKPAQSKQADSNTGANKPVKAHASRGSEETPPTELKQSVAHSNTLRVLKKKIPRGLGWKPERYESAENLLSQGEILIPDGANYRTSQGNIMNFRTVRALVKLEVLILA